MLLYLFRFISVLDDEADVEVELDDGNFAGAGAGAAGAGAGPSILDWHDNTVDQGLSSQAPFVSVGGCHVGRMDVIDGVDGFF